MDEKSLLTKVWVDESETTRKVLARIPDGSERWQGDLEFFGSKRPAAPMAWSFLFDIVHHRGQITTYLRPMGRPCRRSTARVATSPDPIEQLIAVRR